MKGYSEKTGREITMDDVMKEFNKDFDEDDAETIGFSYLFKILKAAGLIEVLSLRRKKTNFTG